MRVLLAILVAVACGTGIGAGTAVIRIRQNPWMGGLGNPPPVGGGQVSLNEEEFNFGKMDSREAGTHEFILTNRGNRHLILHLGSNSCACTISEIKDSDLAAGQSTKVLVTWHSKDRIGPFQQSVTIVTDDPLRPEVTLTIKGEYTRSVYADPIELAFGQIAGNEPVTHEARILCNLPGQQIRIERHQLSDPTLESFFQVDDVPLGADELRKYKDAKSGLVVRVTVKPGLPLGPFQQRILLSTNMESVPEVELPLFGTVGEVTLVGSGWNSATSLLDIGPVDGRSPTQRRLVVLARGPRAKEMRFKVASVQPDFLKVTLGKTVVSDSGMLSQTELLIEIPASKALGKQVPANYLDAENGKLGEILLETTQPPIHSLRIRVRFAVPGGS